MSNWSVLLHNYQPMNNTQFLEQIYEIAFGDDAINKGYTQEDVINRLMD